MGFLKGFFSFITSFLLSNRCLICHAALYEPAGFLPSYIPEKWPEETVEFLQKRFMFKIPGGISVPGSVLCPDCWMKLHPVSDYPAAFIDDVPVIAPFRTNDTLLNMIRYLKFSGGKSAAQPISWWMTRTLKRYFYDYNDSKWAEVLIVPVPLHNSRLRRRGYNQALLMASYISAELGCAFSESLLLKTRNTKSQSSLDVSDRAENVLNAFTAANIGELDKKDIVIVDDLATTGETARECLRTLKRKGVSAAALLCAGTSLKG